jgi:methyl-accepting chemotaxis protein
MFKFKLPKKTVARQLALLSFVGLVLVLLGASVAIGVLEHRSTHALMVSSVAERVQGIVASTDASDQVNRGLVVNSFGALRRNFDRAVVLDPTSGELMSGGNAINDDFQVVDKYARDTGGVVSVYAKKGDDFVSITSSLRKGDGARDIGTVMDKQSPAYKLVMAGEGYSGVANLYGKPYMTRYEAMKDASGAIVGVLFSGTDVSFQQFVMGKQIADTQFFETGGVYYIDASGPLADARFLVHPNAKGKKVLEAYPDAGKFLDALAAAPDGYVRHALPFLGEPDEDRWAVMRKTKEGNGWIVAEVSEHEAMAPYWLNMRMVWGLLGVAALLLAVVLFLLVRRMVSQPLGELATAINQVTQGDLTQALRSQRNDEIGELVNQVDAMRQRYSQTLLKVRGSVDSIGTASSEIASGSQDLSVRTERAATNLQTAATNMEQLTGAVKSSADAARQANLLAASAAEVAARGGAAVGDVVSTMDEINRSSKKISDIIGVIDGIAFQTNILALNAAVEAARAGEQGRGFAVVASEVRNLAGRSADAAKEIKLLIGASVQTVANGSRLVRNAGDTMNEIVGSVQRVSAIIGEITAAAGEQSDGIAQVNHSVGELDQMTQQNAALVEESAAAAESLRDQAQLLAQAVEVFRLSPEHQHQHLALPPA